MIKKASVTGLRHSPPENEDYPLPKGPCRHLSGQLRANYIPNSENRASHSSNVPLTFPATAGQNSVVNSTQLKTKEEFPVSPEKQITDLRQSKERTYYVPTVPAAKKAECSDSKLPPFRLLLKCGLSKNTPSPESTEIMGNGKTAASQMDPQAAYENMVIGYFMPNSGQQQVLKTPLPSSSGKHRSISNSQAFRCAQVVQTHMIPSMNMDLLPSPPNSSNSPAESTFFVPAETIRQERGVPFCCQETGRGSNCQNAKIVDRNDCGMNTTFKAETNIPSGICTPDCSLLSGEVKICSSQCDEFVDPYFEAGEASSALTDSKPAVNVCDLKPSISRTNITNTESADTNKTVITTELGCNIQSTLISPIEEAKLFNFEAPLQSQIVNTASNTFIPSENSAVTEAQFQNNYMSSCSKVCSVQAIGTTYAQGQTAMNVLNDCKAASSLGRYCVLPPVANCTSANAIEGDRMSITSYNSNNSIQGPAPSGMFFTSFSPLTDQQSSVFTGSPRYSARSSFSGRGSRNKRALSNSPLSAEGIDLNSIIRMSPTSLMTYLNGSRSSSSCVSPGSSSEKTGCYGHLSARNSSSSPQSGSCSSGARRSIPQTPKSSVIPSYRRDSHNRDNFASIALDDAYKADFLDFNNDFILQAMQELESGCTTSVQDNLQAGNSEIFPHSMLVPDCENLRILPQDMAAYRTDEYINFVPQSIYSPVYTNIQSHPSSLVPPQVPTNKNLPPLPNKPPPTYDQHMARKALLKKKSSSDSSQPSNSNSSSFESTESDKTTGGGSSSTENEQKRMYECRWMDCSSVFQDQDEFVTHIDKQHVDQKKGEEFICLWRPCPRRLHPFNARYKLQMHMRVHSGDKPNKCTYTGCKKAFSRLENLKIHMRSHTGERPYPCLHQGCPKTFSNSSDRAKHQKTHQEMRPYVCQVPGCGKRYTDPSSLRKHAKGSHVEKKEQGRKKIKGGVEELDPKDLSDCLVIQSIKPVPHYDISPPEPTDSGLGRSPRGSYLGSSTEYYTGFGTSAETCSSRSGTAQGSSNQASPSSHHGSPHALSDISEKSSRQSNASVPSLPPISKQCGGDSAGKHHPQISRSRPPSLASSRAGGCSSSTSLKGPCNKISLSTMTRELVVDQAPLVTCCGSPNIRPFNSSSKSNRIHAESFQPIFTFDAEELYCESPYK